MCSRSWQPQASSSRWASALKLSVLMCHVFIRAGLQAHEHQDRRSLRIVILHFQLLFDGLIQPLHMGTCKHATSTVHATCACLHHV